jgi:hypothetical protein
VHHVFPKLAVYNSVDPSLAPSLLMVCFHIICLKKFYIGNFEEMIVNMFESATAGSAM